MPIAVETNKIPLLTDNYNCKGYDVLYKIRKRRACRSTS